MRSQRCNVGYDYYLVGNEIVHNFWSNGSGIRGGNFTGAKVVQHFALPCFPPCQGSSNGRILRRKG